MPTQAPPALLSAQNLIAILPGDAGGRRVLDGVSVILAQGEIADVVGPSGAGKTTLLRAIALLLPGSSGDLALDGESPSSMGPERWRAAVSLLPQKPTLVPGDVASNLRLPWTLKIRRAQTPPADSELRSALDRLGLEDIALDRDVSRLSVGQQARVALLRVLVTRPHVLLLDEPDAALDSASAQAVADGLRAFVAEGAAVLRVRHRESDGLTARRLLLSGGTLAEEVGV